MSIRCKMQLESVIPRLWGGVQANYRCAYDERLVAEDREFSKATPDGMFQVTVNNPVAIAQMEIGRHYYFDISPVPDAADELKADEAVGDGVSGD